MKKNGYYSSNNQSYLIILQNLKSVRYAPTPSTQSTPSTNNDLNTGSSTSSTPITSLYVNPLRIPHHNTGNGKNGGIVYHPRPGIAPSPANPGEPSKSKDDANDAKDNQQNSSQNLGDNAFNKVNTHNNTHFYGLGKFETSQETLIIYTEHTKKSP